MVYKLMKQMIQLKRYNQADATRRTNAFFAADQITEEEFFELLALIESTYE